MRIDAHQHFWTIRRRESGWPTPELALLHRDFGPADLLPHLSDHAIGGTVLVQSEASRADTDFMLELAAGNPFIKAVVGWVDFEAADAPAQIARLAANPVLRGLRPMLQDIGDDAWICRPTLEPAIAALLRHGLRFDALVYPRQLPPLHAFARRHPELPIVIDHAAKPTIAAGTLDPWRADIAALAALPNLRCKISGLVTEARADWQIGHLRPYVAHLLQVFGPRRLIWGSDWPVLNLAGNYGRWVDASERLLADVASSDRAAIFGDNARQFYGLD